MAMFMSAASANPFWDLAPHSRYGKQNHQPPHNHHQKKAPEKTPTPAPSSVRGPPAHHAHAAVAMPAPPSVHESPPTLRHVPAGARPSVVLLDSPFMKHRFGLSAPFKSTYLL